MHHKYEAHILYCYLQLTNKHLLLEHLKIHLGCKVQLVHNSIFLLEKLKAPISLLRQEKELAAAAEKLAECQETIFLLGKQLKSLRPQTDILGSPRNQRVEACAEEEATISGMDLDASEMDTFHLHKAGSESPLDPFNASSFSPLDSEANNLLKSPVSSKHRPTKSGSSSASSTPTPEKHARGFTRFFSSKAKNAQ